jgi:hypothetical protein
MIRTFNTRNQKQVPDTNQTQKKRNAKRRMNTPEKRRIRKIKLPICYYGANSSVNKDEPKANR